VTSGTMPYHLDIPDKATQEHMGYSATNNKHYQPQAIDSLIGMLPSDPSRQQWQNKALVAQELKVVKVSRTHCRCQPKAEDPQAKAVELLLTHLVLEHILLFLHGLPVMVRHLLQ
jgi:hypothetical protein